MNMIMVVRSSRRNVSDTITNTNTNNTIFVRRPGRRADLMLHRVMIAYVRLYDVM